MIDHLDLNDVVRRLEPRQISVCVRSTLQLAVVRRVRRAVLYRPYRWLPRRHRGTCQVLINGRAYPVVTGGEASAHSIIDVGLEKHVNVGDTATLIGADDPAIDPMTIAAKASIGFYQMITKFSALLPRRLG